MSESESDSTLVGSAAVVSEMRKAAGDFTCGSGIKLIPSGLFSMLLLLGAEEWVVDGEPGTSTDVIGSG